MFAKKEVSELKAILFLYAIEYYAGKRKAAAQMNISIDTISKYIKELEDDFGADFLVCCKKNSVLTEHGRHIVKYAEAVAKELNNIYKVVAEKDELKGEVKIVWDNNIPIEVMSVDFWPFIKKYPNIHIISKSVDMEQDNDLSMYDIAFSCHYPNKENWKILHSESIKANFFVGKKYIKKYGCPKTMQDMLENHRMIFKEDCEKWLKNSGFFKETAKNKVYMSDSYSKVCDAVCNDVGVGILPQFFTDNRIVKLDNIECPAEGSVYLLAHGDYQEFLYMKTTIDYLINLFSKIN